MTITRFIEVKGRASVGEVALTINEYKTAKRLGSARQKTLFFENIDTNPCLVLVFFGVICGKNFLLRHVVEGGSRLR